LVHPVFKILIKQPDKLTA